MHDRRSAAICRRVFLLGAGASALAGCTTAAPEEALTLQRLAPALPPAPPLPPMYFAMPNERFPLPLADVTKIDPRWWRADVEYPSPQSAGTVIVDTPNRYLYHLHGRGRATRYGVSVGREGFAWAGRGHIAYKREWPRWNPPDEMVVRQPSLEPYSIANGGMPGGLRNPLGARALYIHEGNRDTIYRIHGDSEYWMIGQAVSSGCVRMINQDVIHLADTVRDGSPIVVIPDLAMEPTMIG